jgi:hypothetical protein
MKTTSLKISLLLVHFRTSATRKRRKRYLKKLAELVDERERLLRKVASASAQLCTLERKHERLARELLEIKHTREFAAATAARLELERKHERLTRELEELECAHKLASAAIDAELEASRVEHECDSGHGHDHDHDFGHSHDDIVKIDDNGVKICTRKHVDDE